MSKTLSVYLLGALWHVRGQLINRWAWLIVLHQMLAKVCVSVVPKLYRRLLLRVVKMSEPAAKRAPSHSESYKGLFQSVFPTLVKELTEGGIKNPEISDGIQHLREVRFSHQYIHLATPLDISKQLYCRIIFLPLCLYRS